MFDQKNALRICFLGLSECKYETSFGYKLHTSNSNASKLLDKISNIFLITIATSFIRPNVSLKGCLLEGRIMITNMCVNIRSIAQFTKLSS
jgi:hypothetical protein